MITKNSALAAQKAEFRAKLKEIRAAIPQTDRETFSKTITQTVLALEEISLARHIFIYISYGNEVGTHELIDALLTQGKQLCVPKIINSASMLAVPFSSWQELKTGQLGILTPKDSNPVTATIDVVITPGLGFTEEGYRIGYGRGYYDQWFSQHPVQHRIALAFADQILDELPVDEFDIPVSKILTNTRIIDVQSIS